jgi:hypothetical protein
MRSVRGQDGEQDVGGRSPVMEDVTGEIQLSAPCDKRISDIAVDSIYKYQCTHGQRAVIGNK